MELKETREIKSAEQTDLKEKPITKEEVKKKALEQGRIGTTSVVFVPYEEAGKKYTFKIKPMNLDQQCYFADKYPSEEKASTEEMQEKLSEIKKVLLEQITEAPDGLDVTLDYLDALKPALLLDLISALSGGFEEGFTK